jgi:homoserine acetyltransferase
MATHKQFFHHGDFVTETGWVLTSFTMAYRTVGTLNLEKSNAILICPALNAGCDVTSTLGEANSGWWEVMVGPGCPIDTDKFFVVCPSNLGTPFGSSPFRSKQNERPCFFPQLTVLD